MRSLATILSAVLLAAGLVLAAGCGGDDDDGGAGTGQTQTGGLLNTQTETTGGEGSEGTTTESSSSDSGEESAVRTALEDYLNALIDGDSAAACDLLSDTAAEQLVDLAKGQEGVSHDCESVVDASLASVPKGQLKKVLHTNITSVEVDGERARVELEGAPSPIPLVKVDGEWKIAEFEGAG